MNFWNYIDDFFLFRWLFGKRGKSRSRFNRSEGIPTVGNNPADDPADVEELDDLDIFMRDNPISNSTPQYDYQDCDGYSDNNSQSFNDFIEEEDDYDLMDDFLDMR